MGIYKKYGKKILASRELTLDGRLYQCLIIDDDKYFNVHIITEKFKDDESNTLQMQEPKSEVKLEEITTMNFMFARIFEFFIWDKLYYLNPKEYYSANITLDSNER